MPSEQTFSATYDRTTRIVSTIASVLLLLIAVAARSPIVAGLMALVLFLASAYSPRAYVISDRMLTIKRLIGDIQLPLEGFRRVRVARGDDLTGCVRLWGSGGLFGYYGLFRTAGLGKCNWYVTNKSKAVVVITAGKTIVLSPDDENGFLGAIRARVPALEPATAGDEPLFRTLDAASNARGSSFVGIAIGVVAIAIAAAAMLYSPGAPTYTLTPDSLTIHDRFYPVTVNAATVDIPDIRIVDIDVDKDWQPTKRTNGFGNPHYHAGWFQVASGKKVRLYRADSRRLVLLPPKSDAAPVLLEVKEPEQFVQELRRQWAGHATVANRF